MAGSNNRSIVRRSLLTLLLIALPLTCQADCVILLHGLARTSGSMEPVEELLTDEGYTVVNVDYPSRDYPIEILAPMAIDEGLLLCPANEPVHFVTHSLGGILVRYFLERNEIDLLGRVVMLAPPNQGSEVVDKLSGVGLFNAFNGPAGEQLGTDDASIPSNLGPVDYEVGVIAGTRSINVLLSQYLPNPDDGKVSVASTKVAGMSDFITVAHSHPLIMNADDVHEQIVAFLQTGRFEHEESD